MSTYVKPSSAREAFTWRLLPPAKRRMALILLVGGPAVLGSYVWGIATYPALAPRLWGDIPPDVQVPYTSMMFVATAGFFMYTWFLWRHVDPAEVRVAGRFGFDVFNWAYAGILIFSTIWMPLSLAALDVGTAAWMPAIVVVLWGTALSSLTMVAAVAFCRPAEPKRNQRIALLGTLMFCVQTVVLDALIWPFFFRIGG